jgi:hypothetical protein
MTTWCSEPKPRDRQGKKSLCSQRRGNCLPRCCAARLGRPKGRLVQQREPRNGVLVSPRAKGTRAHWRSPNDRVTGRSMPHSVQFSKTACPQAHRWTDGAEDAPSLGYALGGSRFRHRTPSVGTPYYEADRRSCQRSFASFVIGMQHPPSGLQKRCGSIPGHARVSTCGPISPNVVLRAAESAVLQAPAETAIASATLAGDDALQPRRLAGLQMATLELRERDGECCD